MNSQLVYVESVTVHFDSILAIQLETLGNSIKVFITNEVKKCIIHWSSGWNGNETGNCFRAIVNVWAREVIGICGGDGGGGVIW